MLAKISAKNQLTLPKKVVEKLGFAPHEEKYMDVELAGNKIVLKPVVVSIEERIPDEQWNKFRQWALKGEDGDVAFESLEKAQGFLSEKTTSSKKKR